MLWFAGNAHDVHDIEQPPEALHGEFPGLAEIQTRLRSFVSQLDDAPSEEVMLPNVTQHADSPEADMPSPSPERAQSHLSEPASFVAGNAVTRVCQYQHLHGMGCRVCTWAV